MTEFKTGTLYILSCLKHIFLDLWLVKVVLTALTAAWINNALLILLIVFMVIADTLTKIIGLTKGYVAAIEGKSLQEVTKTDVAKNLIFAFYAGIISSKGLKSLLLKLALYGILVLIALWLEQTPKKIIFGIDTLKTLADMTFVAIVCTEMYSILENFRDMGSTFVDRLQSLIMSLFERMGGKWSISGTIKKEEDKNG